MLKNILILAPLSLLIACQINPYDRTNTQAGRGNLEHTDGSGLQAKPAPLNEALQAKLFAAGKASCDTKCVTPFGTVLGEVDQTPAYSNCQSSCIKPSYSFLNLTSKAVSNHNEDPEDANLHYIGVVYQCVEYARRWWMVNKGITFGSVDSAHEIIYLTQGKDIYTKDNFPLARSINGSATRPPARGDLVIYYAQDNNPDWRYGHVAVVVGVDLKTGVVSLAEENYNNQPWKEPEKFSRQIRLTKEREGYQLLDIDPSGKPHNNGEISGWIYPK